eukprot:CAMPEP_0179112248 /NCGR_PEP_ID=MMETSP0796-20121207/52462_1 /TAXON_ID=73915 /ORGANISM="Pyrodinium bahamense, Strain pbaha01" /LENGTH=30 /DNA_ID= /DNA_START= /DNA_END= /DNA_ORIENTATION=
MPCRPPSASEVLAMQTLVPAEIAELLAPEF